MIREVKPLTAEMEANLRERLAQNPFVNFMGVQVPELGEGYARFTLEIRPDFHNSQGFLQGGVYEFFAGSCFGWSEHVVHSCLECHLICPRSRSNTAITNSKQQSHLFVLLSQPCPGPFRGRCWDYQSCGWIIPFLLIIPNDWSNCNRRSWFFAGEEGRGGDRMTR